MLNFGPTHISVVPRNKKLTSYGANTHFFDIIFILWPKNTFQTLVSCFFRFSQTFQFESDSNLNKELSNAHAWKVPWNFFTSCIASTHFLKKKNIMPFFWPKSRFEKLKFHFFRTSETFFFISNFYQHEELFLMHRFVAPG